MPPAPPLHADERDQLILQLAGETGFVSFQQLDQRLYASPATLRRDLERLAKAGKLVRVRGGARLTVAAPAQLSGVPFHDNIARFAREKAAIGRVAASLCQPGESVIIDGGSTTLQMCAALAPLGLHVLTNSLHIVSALLPQAGTRISMPAGTIFREQNIVLSPFEVDGMAQYRATKLFMGAASIGRHGLMQSDVLLVQTERRFLQRADRVVVLADSSKFRAPAGHVFCSLDQIDTLVTDAGLADADAAMLREAGIEVIIAA